MDKFWRWVKNQAGKEQVRTLYLEGYIAQNSWYDDDVSPKQFKEELYEDELNDDIIVKIHSAGGDCFASAQIYNMLQEYPGKVTVHIDGLAASAASVIAMAGDEIYVSPLSIIMIHNPSMFVGGEASDLEVGINLLNEVKESIINAYEKKTKLSRVKISHMMSSETWMSAQKAIDLNFADHILYEDEATENVFNSFMFDKLTVTNALRDKLPGVKANMTKSVETGSKETHKKQKEPETEGFIAIEQLEKRLKLIKNWR